MEGKREKERKRMKETQKGFGQDRISKVKIPTSVKINVENLKKKKEKKKLVN